MLNKRQITQIKGTLSENSQDFTLAFQALGDQCRFKIFKILLKHHDICVSDIANICGISVSAASQQLRILERLGLVLKVRMGQMVCYEVNGKNQVVKQLRRLLVKSNN